MSADRFNTDIEHDGAALMAQNGDKAKDGRKRVLVVGAGAAGYVERKRDAVKNTNRR